MKFEFSTPGEYIEEALSHRRLSDKLEVMLQGEGKFRADPDVDTDDLANLYREIAIVYSKFRGEYDNEAESYFQTSINLDCLNLDTIESATLFQKQRSQYEAADGVLLTAREDYINVLSENSDDAELAFDYAELLFMGRRMSSRENRALKEREFSYEAVVKTFNFAYDISNEDPEMLRRACLRLIDVMKHDAEHFAHGQEREARLQEVGRAAANFVSGVPDLRASELMDLAIACKCRSEAFSNPHKAAPWQRVALALAVHAHKQDIEEGTGFVGRSLRKIDEWEAQCGLVAEDVPLPKIAMQLKRLADDDEPGSAPGGTDLAR